MEKKKPKKLVKTIALTHTKTTHQICVPSKVVKDMQIADETDVWIEYDYETRTMTLNKIGDK